MIWPNVTSTVPLSSAAGGNNGEISGREKGKRRQPQVEKVNDLTFFQPWYSTMGLKKAGPWFSEEDKTVCVFIIRHLIKG